MVGPVRLEPTTNRFFLLGESGGTLLKGRIARAFLDIDFRFALVRTYREPRLNVSPIRTQQVEDS